MLKPAKSLEGYLKTMLLNDEGEYKSWTVHKFICLVFLGERNGLEVNHKNGIKTDNRIENLEYVTRSENIKHAYKNGLEKPQRGHSNGNSKLSNEDVLDIRDYVKKARENGIRYYGRKKLASKYGVSEAHIKDIISQRRGIWSHI